MHRASARCVLASSHPLWPSGDIWQRCALGPDLSSDSQWLSDDRAARAGLEELLAARLLLIWELYARKHTPSRPAPDKARRVRARSPPVFLCAAWDYF